MKATRADAYADQRNWHDTGCEVAPSCLACPLPRCRYDYVGGVRALQNLTRDAEIRQRLDAGETTTAVAAHFGVTRRTVFRVRHAELASPFRRRTDVLNVMSVGTEWVGIKR